MEKHSHVFEKFATFENMYDGYLLARRNKRYRPEVLAYSANLEENIINAVNHLQWGTYETGQPRPFYEYFPKLRLIHALPFFDRVVNCAAYHQLWPIYSRSFYEHSYGSIPNRGQLAAIDTLTSWMQYVSGKATTWYIGKLDIAKFFFRIPVEVQMRELMRPLDDERMRWFLDTAIRCDGRPFGLPLAVTDVTTCERICGLGMQVGSLISQTTANVVLSPVDHYIKRVMRVPYYIRYMDDMMILMPSKTECWEAIAEIDDHLQENFGLQLNDKTAVVPVGTGVEFIGRMVWPGRSSLRKSTSLNMKRHLRYVMEHYSTGELPMEYCLSVIQSYLGLMKHCDCDDLRNKTIEDFVLVRHHFGVDDEQIDDDPLF
ncbi:MAG: RNA-directed DNA polymerase [Oscillospiraceae bacterium]|nr:RNA-directed DNA polymerase [Clostridium sp.]MBQ7436099.1 RNA-directed DNA polymerase [Oscillospiraceae bacterium]